MKEGITQVPKFENKLALEIVQGIKVFLKVEVGITRDETKESVHGSDKSKVSASGRIEAQTQRIKQAGRQIARRGRTVRAEVRRRANGESRGGVRPENILWIFGTARSGSTWLASMMDELDRHAAWNEPLVGSLFGNFYYERAQHRVNEPGKNFILGQTYKDTWIEPMRDLVLGGAAARFPEVVDRGYVVIKEPNGSVGAPLLMEALPESRMILLVRDPRDVVASSIDSRKEGSWRYQRRQERGDIRAEKAADKIAHEADQFAKTRAEGYVRSIGNAKAAFEAHKGRKVLIKYEDLRADTLGTMRRLYSTLEIPVDEGELARSVEKHSWENIPEEKKGEGKFYRKATPGGWQEDLTPRQAEIVERITAPLLEEFYPA